MALRLKYRERTLRCGRVIGNTVAPRGVKMVRRYAAMRREKVGRKGDVPLLVGVANTAKSVAGASLGQCGE